MKRFVITEKGLEPLNKKSVERAKQSAIGVIAGVIPEKIVLTAKEWYDVQVIIAEAYGNSMEYEKGMNEMKRRLYVTAAKIDDVVSDALRRAQREMRK